MGESVRVTLRLTGYRGSVVGLRIAGWDRVGERGRGGGTGGTDVAGRSEGIILRSLFRPASPFSVPSLFRIRAAHEQRQNPAMVARKTREQPTPEPTRLTMTLEGSALPHPVQVTGIGAGSLTVADPIAAPPCEVDLVVRQGAREQRRKLRLPDGLRADSPQVRFEPVGW